MKRAKHRHAIALPIAAGLVLTLALAGCAGDPGGTPPAQDSAGRYVIRMNSNLTFDPVEARIPLGATVVWINNSTVIHDINGYEGDPPGDETAFSSSLEEPYGDARVLRAGDEYTHTFTSKGTWTIWCHAHHEERMKGLVHVV